MITAGAWSPKVLSTLFPSANTRIPTAPLAGHSLLLKNPRYNPEAEENGCHAVFATDTLGFSPELFSRVGGEIYIAGLNSTQISLPDVATDIKPDSKAIKQLKDCAAAMVGFPEGGEGMHVLRESLVRLLYPLLLPLEGFCSLSTVLPTSDIERPSNHFENS